MLRGKRMARNRLKTAPLPAEDFASDPEGIQEAAVAVPAENASGEALGRATALHDAGSHAEAEALLRHAIEKDPANGLLRNARGVMFAAMGRHLDALWCYRDALVWAADNPGIWTNLGNALTELKHLKGAVACHRRAIELAGGGDALLHHNLGTSLSASGQYGESVIAFTRAIKLDPGHHLARWDRARSYLYLGNYRAGWSDYEVRLISGQLPQRQLPGEKWDGSPYPGKRLVVVVEQGMGDTLWAARYLPRVKALGGELVVECQEALVPLIGSMKVADQVVSAAQMRLPSADFYCYWCSLPGLFTPDLASIPAEPYLTAPHDRRTKFLPLSEAADGRLKVGIVWSGSVTFKKNHERAQPLLHFFQAFALPGVQLYSLQKGPPEMQLRSLPRGGPIIDLSPHLNDFADTAAAMSQLDLVIMTDSAVAHLAGAMGKPVWLLLGQVAHWLWLLDRTDSPWYPTVRLFRPRAEGDWDYVFDSASVALMDQAVQSRMRSG